MFPSIDLPQSNFYPASHQTLSKRLGVAGKPKEQTFNKKRF